MPFSLGFYSTHILNSLIILFNPLQVSLKDFATLFKILLHSSMCYVNNSEHTYTFKKHWCTFWVAPKQADTHIHRQPFGGHYNHYHHHHLPNHHHRTAAASQRQRRIIVQMFSSVRQWDSFKAKSMEFSRVIDHDDHLVAKAAGMALSLKHNMLMTQPKMVCCQQAVLCTLCRVEKMCS